MLHSIHTLESSVGPVIEEQFRMPRMAELVAATFRLCFAFAKMKAP
jgi:hypothetical protein